MAALKDNDAYRFARAMGIENPSEEYLAAAKGLPANIDGLLPAQKPAPASGQGVAGGTSGPRR